MTDNAYLEVDLLRFTHPTKAFAVDAAAASLSAPKSTTDIPVQLNPAVEPRSEDWDICRSRQDGIEGLFETRKEKGYSFFGIEFSFC